MANRTTPEMTAALALADNALGFADAAGESSPLQSVALLNEAFVAVQMATEGPVAPRACMDLLNAVADISARGVAA